MLQKTLAANRELLLESHDILYPSHEESQFQLRAYFSDAPQDLIQLRRLGISDRQAATSFLDRYFAAFDRQIKGSRAQTLLLSSEYFSGMTDPELRRFRTYLEGIAEEVVLLAYVRDPWSFSVSWLQQNLRDGLWQGPIRPSYYRGNIEILDRFADAFGTRPCVRPYVAIHQKQLDVVEDFLQWIGITDTVGLLKRAPQKENAAMGWKCACIVSHLNALFPSVDPTGRYVGNPARDWIVEKVLAGGRNDQPIRISAQTARQIYVDSQQDMARLQQSYLGGEDVFFRAYEQASFADHDDLISIDGPERNELLAALFQAQYALAVGWIEDVAAIRATKSWRITEPLRVVYRFLHGVSGNSGER